MNIAKPVQIAGKGWDVLILSSDGVTSLLCEGRGPYTQAQAQVAAALTLAVTACKPLTVPTSPSMPRINKGE